MAPPYLIAGLASDRTVIGEPVEVEVCTECGTVYAPSFFCPTCTNHPRGD